MRPYFEQDGVTIYHGACVDVLATMAPRSVKLIITDPPYTGLVHKGMRSNKGRRGRGKDDARGRPGGTEYAANGATLQSVNRIDFPPFSHDDMAASFAAMGRAVSRWILATTAFEHAGRLCDEPPPGLRFIRAGAWVKSGPTPQMTGDRPAQGWEAIAMLHAEAGEAIRWNGGGRAAVYHCQAEMHGVYPTQKPERLIHSLLSDFADHSDDILDPFMGSGTTLLCGWRRGHLVTGCDIREAACEIAAKRIELAMRQGRMPFSAPAPTKKDQTGLAF